MTVPVTAKMPFLLALLLVLAPSLARGQATLSDYLAWAERHDPSLAAMTHDLDRLESEARRAGSLPDFRLGYSEMLVPVETRVGPQQRALSLAQSVPWFGTLGWQRQVVLDRRTAAEFRLQERTLELHQEVRNLWYSLGRRQQEQALLREQLDLATQQTQVVEAGYQVGDDQFSGLVAARNEVDRLNNRLAESRDHADRLARDLALLTGAPEDTAPPVADLEPLDIPDLGRDALLARLESGHPALKAEDWAVEAARSAERVAGKSSLPTITLGLDYIMTGEARNPGTPDSGQDPVIARVGLSLPLWSGRAHAEKMTAASAVSLAASRREQVRLKLERRLEDAGFAERSARRTLDLYDTSLLPRARQELEVARAAYVAGSTSHAGWIASQRHLLDLELARLQAHYSLCRARNEIWTLLAGTDHLPLRPRQEKTP
jgi:outer membrane protein TolC